MWGKKMSFLNDNIITEIYLKNNTIFKSNILKNYPQEQQSDIDMDDNIFNFNLAKFETNPFPGLALFLRRFLNEEKDSDLSYVDIEERYVAFILAKEISFFRLMDVSFLLKKDKSLLLINE